MVETILVALEIQIILIQTMPECCFYLYLWTNSLPFVRSTSIKKVRNTRSKKGVAKDSRGSKNKEKPCKWSRQEERGKRHSEGKSHSSELIFTEVLGEERLWDKEKE